MCKLAGINFGYADSEKELIQMPELFDEAFVDPKNNLEKLMDGLQFLVLGRKGTGKTAYSAKIRRMASQTENMYAQSCTLSDLNYSDFETFAEENVRGGRRFINIWKYILLLEIVKLINESVPNQENREFDLLIADLKEKALISSDDITHESSRTKKSNVEINISGIIKIEHEKQSINIQNEKELISDTIMQRLKCMSFGNDRFYIILDGLDDAVRGESFSSDIITGLMRAASALNAAMYYAGLGVKIIMLLRTDIYELCVDPDLNKIKRDLSIDLSWSKDDLANIVLKRIQVKYKYIKRFSDFWYNFAPNKYKNTPSEKTLYEMTLLRPRDILQFFIETQKIYEQQDKLSYSEFSNAMSAYSKNYFASEMKDELAGFITDDAVRAVSPMLSEIGKRIFCEQDVCDIIAEYKIEEDAHELLEKLFSIGYIGQQRSNNDFGKHFSFVYINPYDRYSSKDACVIHRGLTKALNVR